MSTELIVGSLSLIFIGFLLKMHYDGKESLKKEISLLREHLDKQSLQINEITNTQNSSTNDVNNELRLITKTFDNLNATHNEILEKENRKLTEFESIFQRGEQLKNEYNNGYDTGYKKGQADAVKTQGWEVQISPWKEDAEEGTIFKKQTVKIGYKYQLFVNGVPCFEPHIQIYDILTTTKLDAESVNIAVSGLKEVIGALANIHPSIKTVGDGANLAKSLLSLTGKN